MNVDNKLTNEELKEDILRLKKDKNAVILGHYYQQGDIQDVADIIGDSLALAQKASKIDAPILVMCGVYFMAETCKIICPDKKVLIPDATAGCSLADSCPADEFENFIKEHPGHTVVSYVNTSAAVKALTDIVVTSSNARKIIDSLPEDEKIIFGPDRNLGSYINSITGRDMLLWDGACHVHDRFSIEKLVEMKREHPQAKTLAHPECRKQLLILADKVGSTAALLKYAVESEYSEFIVATESGILHEMQKQCPHKVFLPVPAEDSTCGCNDCNYMKLNTLEKLRDCLLYESPEVVVDSDIAVKALNPINRMLAFS